VGPSAYKLAAPAREEGTLNQVAADMAALGYKVEWVDGRTYPRACTQGLYLARHDDSRTWDEIASCRMKHQPEVTWRGLAVVSRLDPVFAAEEKADQFVAGPLVFYGDPVEIERIADHYRRQGDAPPVSFPVAAAFVVVSLAAYLWVRHSRFAGVRAGRYPAR